MVLTETAVGPAECVVGVDAVLACPVDEAEEEVADFLFGRVVGVVEVLQVVKGQGGDGGLVLDAGYLFLHADGFDE